MDNYIIYNMSAYGSSGLSIILNSVLIFLILKKTSKEMKSYSHVMLQTCVVDMIFALVLGFSVIQIETSDVRIYFRTSSWVPPYGIYPCLAMFLFMACLHAVMWNMIIQALFRYLVIVRRTTPNANRTWLLLFGIFIFAALLSLLYLCKPCQNVDLSYNDSLRSMVLWKDYPLLINTFRSIPIHHYLFIGYGVIMFAVTFTTTALFFLSNWQVKKELNSSKVHFSQQTLIIHKQFGRRMILQSIMPCFSLIALVITFILIFAVPAEFARKQDGYMLFAFMPFHYIVVFNPLITLLSIKNYRRAFLCQSKKEISSIAKITKSKSTTLKSITKKVASMIPVAS